MKYDLIILGGGPGGYKSAEFALKRNEKVLIIENKKIGGVCLNYGCIPSKIFLHNSKLYSAAKNSQQFGFNASDVIYDQKISLQVKNEKVKNIVNGLERSLVAKGCDIVYGNGQINKKIDSLYEVVVNDEKYLSKKIIIATGSQVKFPNINGIENFDKFANFLDSNKALDLDVIPSQMAIIGGGVIALEFATYFSQIGTKVKVYNRSNIMLSKIDEDISIKYINSLKENHNVEFINNCKFIQVNENSLEYEFNSNKYKDEFEYILFATGREPNVKNIGLENIKLDFTNKGIVVNELMETNLVNVFAVGDVCSKVMLAHCGYKQAEIVHNNITGKQDYMNYEEVPFVIYTTPEIAGVGISQRQAKEKNIEIEVISSNLMASGKFIVENSDFEGYIKMIVKKQNKEIIGIFMMGDGSSEVISMCSMIVSKKMTINMLQDIILPHPSVSEIIKNLVY